MLLPLACRNPSQADHAQLYKILVSELTDFVVFLMDPHGCAVSWNPGVEHILGYTEAEWLGQSVERIFTPEDRAQGVPQGELTKADREGRAPDLRWHLRKSGERLYVEGTLVALRNEEGLLLGFSKVMRDITERKQTEAALRASQLESERLRVERDRQLQTFNTVLAWVQEFVYLLDRESRFRYVNQPLLDLWGLTLEQAVGKTFAELGYPEDLVQRFEEQLRSVVNTGQLAEGENTYTSPSGVTGHYEYTFVPLFAPDGSVDAVGGHTRNVTERRQNEAVLRESEDHYRHMVELNPEVPWTADPRGFVESFSYRWLEVTGLTREEALGEGWMQVPHPEDREQMASAWTDSLRTGYPYDVEARLRMANGSYRWWRARAYPRRDEQGQIIRWYGTTEDIHDRKRAEEEVHIRNRDLEEFAHVASHDLQEPLRTVNIYTQLILKNQGGNPAMLDQYAGFVRQGVTRMEGLIRDLLTYSQTVHQDQLPAGTADLSISFRNAVAVLRNRIEESGATIMASVLPAVSGDTKQMAHVFQNLLSNALKYCHPNRAPEISLEAVREGQQWIISLRDNGIGFEPEYAGQIFGLFKRLHKDEYPGTGLGLAICQRIVERYGGRLWAEGRPGQGATFFFALPGAENH